MLPLFSKKDMNYSNCGSQPLFLSVLEESVLLSPVLLRSSSMTQKRAVRKTTVPYLFSISDNKLSMPVLLHT